MTRDKNIKLLVVQTELVYVSEACLMFICWNEVDLWEGHYPVYTPGTENREVMRRGCAVK